MGLVEYSFYLTYAFLLTTGTITFIEALRTKSESVRHILNLETCISVVASFFYGNFVSETTKETMDYEAISLNRYVDWAITTPIMLLVLVLAFQYNSTKKATVHLTDYVVLLILNYGMLGTGYVGEVGELPLVVATIVGFVFFGGLFYKLYTMKGSNPANDFLYGLFFVLWALYGVAYMMTEIPRNVSYNMLDLFSKCFVGIYFWAFYAKIFT